MAYRLRFVLIGLVTSVLIVGLFTTVGWTGTTADDPPLATPDFIRALEASGLLSAHTSIAAAYQAS